jgi:hypothetical protein
MKFSALPVLVRTLPLCTRNGRAANIREEKRMGFEKRQEQPAVL